jgi:hypothetical protein
MNICRAEISGYLCRIYKIYSARLDITYVISMLLARFYLLTRIFFFCWRLGYNTGAAYLFKNAPRTPKTSVRNTLTPANRSDGLYNRYYHKHILGVNYALR